MSGQEKRSERRQVNVSVPADRRRPTTERRKCPDCGGVLKAHEKRIAGGTVRTLDCANCNWTSSHRRTDAEVLLLKLTWELELHRTHGHLCAEIPPELADTLKVKPGDGLVLSPLTSPVGSLPMKWALSVRKQGGKGR